MKTTNSNSDRSIKETVLVNLDGAELNDFPAKYSVPALQSYEFAAVGLWIHPNIVPGFKYKVRPIEAKEVSFKIHFFMVKTKIFNILIYYLFSVHDSYLTIEHWNC